jgi:hypothetical protein
MSESNTPECECSCHSGPAAVHHWPMEKHLNLCCKPCPGCGMSVLRPHWDEHVSVCKAAK